MLPETVGSLYYLLTFCFCFFSCLVVAVAELCEVVVAFVAKQHTWAPGDERSLFHLCTLYVIFSDGYKSYTVDWAMAS